MSYTRARGSTSYTTNTRSKQQEPIELEDGVPKCSGHQRKCKEFTAGPKTKNPGRKFYTCPLGQNDPKRCSYFKWADDIAPSSTGQRLGASTPTVDLLNRVKERYEGNPPQIIGQSPNNRYGKPSGIPASASVSTPTAGRTMVPMTPETHSKLSISRDYDVGDGAAIQEETEEIDWDKVDTDSLERDAIASTPGSSQLLSQQSLLAANDTTTLQQRLMSVAKETPSRAEGSEGKRKREVEDDRDKTPKRPVVDTEDNPFLSPVQLASPLHHALTPSLSNFEQLSAHLHRQDRLIRAGETAKEGFRKTIQRQKEQIEALEKKVKELEQRLG
ncbi:hypothetical protein DB88DRAFT_489035 [Papiliotrema laurentii]|uniref:GRF-type domain-containing protein n=1 Tax=Papiliotrema laurentii TaxID=5418 RepID=A0AAD9CZ27_PAPLA|nr:hypothetical protein DB88DRAFT_489035 [Papiliotrema laurentii]